MSNPLIPNYVFDNIYQITPELLIKHKVKGILIDLDGTMASSSDPLPSDTVLPFLQSIQNAGIKVLVLSNNKESRVKLFSDALGVKFLHHATKPFKRGFAKGAKMLDLSLKDCAIIGDQIYTDTLGGNLCGAKITCYVKSYDAHKKWISFRYKFERYFVEKGYKLMGSSKN